MDVKRRLNKENLRPRSVLHRYRSHSVSERKAPEFQSEKQSVLNGESEGKRKSAITFVIALFFLVAGEPQISNFFEGYEMVVDLWKYLNRRHE